MKDLIALMSKRKNEMKLNKPVEKIHSQIFHKIYQTGFKS